ncbi:MAG: hypothetical protein KAH57_02085 [Thermoplasmata archaeon]|nr:hypothetical protein [Thermoplasmata archaeon]
MMRTFPLFDPKIYSISIFKLKKGEDGKVHDVVQNLFLKRKDVKFNIIKKDNWSVVEIAMDVQKGGHVIVEVTPDLFKIQYDNMKLMNRTLKDSLASYVVKDSRHYNFNLMTCGSRDNIWMHNYSAASLLMDGDDDVPFIGGEQTTIQENIFQTNIAYLNRIMNRKGGVLINTLRQNNIESFLYALGTVGHKRERTFPTEFLLQLDTSQLGDRKSYTGSQLPLINKSPYSTPQKKDNNVYLEKQEYLINLLSIKAKIIDLLLTRCSMMDLFDGEYSYIQKRGNFLKDDIFDLQNRINSHMKVYIPDKKSKKRDSDFLDRENYDNEKELLTTASIRFTLISEVEHRIMRIRSQINGMKGDIGDMSDQIALKGKASTTDMKPHSISDHQIKDLNSMDEYMTSLSGELTHSRDILSSTIDVLRAFIDTRQREASEDMSRLMNLLFLVFACIGLADALGNFVIFAMEYYFFHGMDVYQSIRPALASLFLTFLPLTIGVVFILIYFKKKRR